MNHKHYETLIRMANGNIFPDDFEYMHNEYVGLWRAAVSEDVHYLMGGYGRFRLKPVPEPDIVRTLRVSINSHNTVLMYTNLALTPNVEFTFAADDHTKPKSVRLLP